MYELYPYQQVGSAWLATKINAMLLDPMGLGKTVQAIRAADRIQADDITVVCPAIARTNWAREFETWGTQRRTIAVVNASTDLERAEVIHADVLIISYSMLASKKARALLEKRHSDVLILDEAHNLKNPKAVRSRAIYGHRFDCQKGLASTAKRVWLLSGTIMPNFPSELWTHAHALFGETRKYGEFCRDFCVMVDDGFSPKIVGGKNENELARLLKPHVLRRRAKDVLTDLPPLRWSHFILKPDKLPPPPLYTPEEAQAMANVDRLIAAGDFEGLAAQAMHLATLRRWTGNAKAAAVAELLLGENEKTVVFAIHKSTIACIAGLLRDGGHSVATIDGSTSDSKKTPESSGDRQLIIDSFQQNADPRVLICQLSIASTALTLTAAHHVVFAETSWVPADLQQAAKRCHRIGQSQPVLARVVSLAGSIDEKVNAALIKKAQFGRDFGLALDAA
jgi:SWI/SNF-related matrix-associated actin-dependent regulator of chromatin subfamily A-like protein 1